MTQSEVNERRELLDQATELILEAQSLVDTAVSGTSIQSNFEAYGRYGFDTLLGNGNPYDGSLDTIIESLSDEIEEDDNKTFDQYQGETHGY